MIKYSASLFLFFAVGCGGRSLQPGDAGPDAGLFDSSLPDVFVEPRPRFIKVASGWHRSCGILNTGRMTCWGDPEGRPTEPIGGRYKDVDVEAFQACAIDEYGNLISWGLETSAPEGTFTEVASTASNGYCCALRQDGLVRCWGRSEPVYYSSPPEIKFKTIALNDLVSCGLVADNTARCWGHPSFIKAFPDDVPLKAIAPGSGVQCGLLASNGEVRCWLGFGMVDLDPVDPFPGIIPVELGTGHHHACVLLKDGAIKCWFSLEKLPDPGDPLPIRGYPPKTKGFVQISVGPDHGCAIHEQGHIECWGENDFGQLDAPDPADL